MNIKKLNLSETVEIYKDHLVKDFPQAEVKPLARIQEMWQEGIYMAYGLFREEALLGYAFFVVPNKGQCILLDYFAICKEMRCGGIGSRFLGMLKKEMKGISGIILEVENPEFAKNTDELELMNRRIAFYERSGICQSQITSCLFGVEYRIMVLSFTEVSEKKLLQELDCIYHSMFSDEIYKENIILRKL